MKFICEYCNLKENIDTWYFEHQCPNYKWRFGFYAKSNFFIDQWPFGLSLGANFQNHIFIHPLEIKIEMPANIKTMLDNQAISFKALVECCDRYFKLTAFS